jgi:type II secretory pathway pseudopilin PulG
MKVEGNNSPASAFTLVEFLVLLACIVILAGMLLPTNPSRKAPVSVCQVNLSQIAAGSARWSTDHQGLFPWEVSFSDGGTREHSATGGVALSYQALSNYLPVQAARLVCPSDKTKRAVTNFADFGEQNVSYFLNLDVVANRTNSILAGDRHLQADAHPVKPGIFNLTTNLAVGWTSELHSSGKLVGGNIALADGGVKFTRDSLQRLVPQQPLSTNRLVIP